MKLYQVYDVNAPTVSDRWFSTQKEAKVYAKELDQAGKDVQFTIQEYPGRITRASIAWMLNNWPKRENQVTLTLAPVAEAAPSTQHVLPLDGEIPGVTV
jgi:hypothetical protein